MAGSGAVRRALSRCYHLPGLHAMVSPNFVMRSAPHFLAHTQLQRDLDLLSCPMSSQRSAFDLLMQRKPSTKRKSAGADRAQGAKRIGAQQQRAQHEAASAAQQPDPGGAESNQNQAAASPSPAEAPVGDATGADAPAGTYASGGTAAEGVADEAAKAEARAAFMRALSGPPRPAKQQFTHLLVIDLEVGRTARGRTARVRWGGWPAGGRACS